MRIFDPKDQLGNSLLSQADTQKSSVKLEKQMAEGGTITLTSTDIGDIENWELSNARVNVDGQMISFLPDTSRDTDGNLVITLGETFSDVVLVLKRTVFDGMKQEEEEITIEVEIRQLMEKTMAAATAPTHRTEEQIQENIVEWKAMGVKAHASDPVKYANATLDTLEGYVIDGTGVVEVNDCLISVDTLAGPNGRITVSPTVTGVKWHADLPSYSSTYGSDDLQGVPFVEWTGKIPNITNAFYMFNCCSGLTSWTVALPNSLTNAEGMFSDCSGLKEFTPSLAGLTNCEWFSYMFSGCILNEASIRNILGTLPNRTDKTEQLTIDIGGDNTMGFSVKNDLSSLAQSVSTAKNWNIVLSWNTPQTPTE